MDAAGEGLDRPGPQPLLVVEGLCVEVGGGGRGRGHRVIDDVCLSVDRGEIVALVGESGSGKSLTARAIIGLQPPGIAITAGSIRCGGDELTALSPRQMDRVRGGRIGMLFQQPQMMLDPTCRIGEQVGEPLRKHRGLSRGAADERAVELLREVGIADPERRARSFAFELSGGIAQRVMIAAALSADPELLIADEPTTALDVTVQAQILRLIDEQRNKRRMGVLLISHDLAVVAAVASRIGVMYAGRIVEEGPAAAVLASPRHPYTRALVACSLLDTREAGRLATIRGSIASAHGLTRGCRYHPRCDVVHAGGGHEDCTQRQPELRAFAGGARASCWALAQA